MDIFQCVICIKLDILFIYLLSMEPLGVVVGFGRRRRFGTNAGARVRPWVGRGGRRGLDWVVRGGEWAVEGGLRGPRRGVSLARAVGP